MSGATSTPSFPIQYLSDAHLLANHRALEFRRDNATERQSINNFRFEDAEISLKSPEVLSLVSISAPMPDLLSHKRLPCPSPCHASLRSGRPMQADAIALWCCCVPHACVGTA